MANLKRVIKALEHCTTQDDCDGCPYDGKCDMANGLDADILALLRKQEPRVLTLDEVLHSQDKLMWLQYKSTIAIDRYVMIPTAPHKKYIPDPYSVIFYTGHVRAKEFYGKTWRCWNMMPDKERLGKWDD